MTGCQPYPFGTLKASTDASTGLIGAKGNVPPWPLWPASYRACPAWVGPAPWTMTAALRAPASPRPSAERRENSAEAVSRK